MEELSKKALEEFDSEIRFKTLALKGDKKSLKLLDKLGKAFGVKGVLSLLLNNHINLQVNNKRMPTPITMLFAQK